MPKMKSHRGAKKRFSVTGTGKVKRAKAYKSHILTKKSPSGSATCAARPPSRPTARPRC
jgi:ribosomal protein L35